jgi:hypothetical protein
LAAKNYYKLSSPRDKEFNFQDQIFRYNGWGCFLQEDEVVRAHVLIFPSRCFNSQLAYMNTEANFLVRLLSFRRAKERLAQIWRPSPKKFQLSRRLSLLFNLAPPFLIKQNSQRRAQKSKTAVGGAFYGYGAHWNLELRAYVPRARFSQANFKPDLNIKKSYHSA